MRYFILFLYFTTFAFAQQIGTLKVFVRDVETGKNIKGCTVQLLALGHPIIIAQYEKKHHYYYFPQIPSGYNTVMVFHEGYNEKGFQYSQGLPNQLEFSLYHRENVSYGFENPQLSHINKDYQKPDGRLNAIYKKLEAGDTISAKSFRYIYAEDPYHIAVISRKASNVFLADTVLTGLLNKYDLEYTESRSRTQDSTLYYCYGFGQYGDFFKDQGGIGFNSCDNGLGFMVTHKAYFFHKKDKTKFSRFDAPEILALRKSGYITAAITNRMIEYYGAKPFRTDRFYDNGNDFRASDTMQDIDQYYEFGHYPVTEVLYPTAKKDRHAEFGRFKEKIGYGTDVDDNVYNLYFVISANPDASGLGVLDMMEYNPAAGYHFNVLPEWLGKL